MKKYLIGIAAALVITGSAFAQTATTYFKAGPVAGIEGGWGQSNFYPKASEDYYGAFVGGAYFGYNFRAGDFNNLLLGAQLGYKWLGYSDETITVAPGQSMKFEGYQQAIDLLFTAKYYVYEGLNMFGKAGFATLIQTTKNMTVDKNGSLLGDETYFRIRPEYQLGIGYNLNQQFDLYLVYTHTGTNFDFETSAYGTQYATARVNSVMVGVSYTF